MSGNLRGFVVNIVFMMYNWTQVTPHPLPEGGIHGIPYTVKSSEQLRKKASDTETKALLYLMSIFVTLLSPIIKHIRLVQKNLLVCL